MNWIIIIVLCVLAMIAACALYGNHSSGCDVSQAQFSEWMAQECDCCILDVRSPGEYALGHIPGAINIGYKEVTSHLDELKPFRDKNVVVYCERGGRARIAQKTLIKAGFSNVYRLTGDMAAWRKAGRPTEIGSQE